MLVVDRRVVEGQIESDSNKRDAMVPINFFVTLYAYKELELLTAESIT